MVALRLNLLAVDRLVVRVVDAVGRRQAIDLIDINALGRIAGDEGRLERRRRLHVQARIVERLPGLVEAVDGEHGIVGLGGLHQVALDALDEDAELVGTLECDGVEVLPGLRFKRP